MNAIAVTSSGIIDVQSGTLLVSTLTQNDGTITLSNGAAFTPSANLTSTGTISGDGTVNANVTSSGTIAPGASPGITIINGDLVLTGASVVDIEVDGTTPGAGGHDQIQVTGTTTLDGTLNVILGFAPTNGDNFNIILCGTDCGGDFVTKNLPPNGFVTNDLGTTYRLEFTGACAGDNCWTAAIDGLWSKAGNWSAGLPVGGQLVLVPDLAGTVTLDTDSTIGSLVLDDDLSITANNTLTISGVADLNAPVTILANGELELNGGTSTIDTVTSNGILTNTGALTVESQMTLNAGFLLGVAGTTTIANGAALSVTGFTELQENTLFNDGVATLTGTLQLSNSGIYNNRILSQTDFQGDVAIGGGGSTLINAGLIRKTAGGGNSTSDSILTNTGTFESQTGTINLTGPSDHDDGTLFANGGNFLLSNGHTFASDSSVTGNGNVTFNGGNHTLDGSYTLVGTTTVQSALLDINGNIDFDILNVTSATVNFNSGTNTVNQLGMSGGAPPLNLAGSLTVNTGFDWSTGTINDVGDTGSFITGAGSVTNINGGAVSVNTLDWTNNGTVNFNSGTLTLNSGIINNGTFNALGGSSLNGAGEFNNAGTFNKTAAGTFTVFSPDFNNTGTVDIDTGTFSHNSNVSTTSGAGVWDLAASAIFQLDGTHTFNNIAPVVAAVDAQMNLVGVGSIANFEAVGTVLPANLTLNNNDTDMTGSGSLRVDGTLNLNTASRVSLNGGLVTTGTTNVDGTTTVDATTWTNQGTVNWNAGAIQLIANGIINNDATFNSLNIAADTMFNSGVFNNNATYNKLGAGDPNISITFNNNGVVDVDVGSFTLTGDSNTSGSFDLAAGTILFLSGTGATHNFNTANPITAVSADLSTSGIGPVVNFNTTGTVLPAGLTVTNAQTIGGSGSLQIDGTFNLENAGNVSVSGGLITTGTSNINGNTSLSGTWNNQGTLDFNTGGIQINGGGILNNESTVNFLNTGTLMFGAGTYNNTAGATTNKPNAGNVTIFTTFNVADTSILDIADGDLRADDFATNSGTLTLAPGTLLDPAAVFINLPTGLIQGSGNLQANVTNQGTIAPGTSPEIITITGNLLLDPTSVLDFEIGGVTPGAGAGFHDQIVVTGNATLDGTINATLFGGFVPVAGNTFDIITCGGTCSGAFVTENLPTDFNLSIIGGNIVQLVFSGLCAGTICWDNGAANGLWIDPLNWNTDVIPVALDDVVVNLGGGTTVTLDEAGVTHTIQSLSATESLIVTNNTTLQVTGVASFSGSADLTLSGGGNADFDGGATLQTVSLTGSSLDGDGDITANGLFTWTGGNILGNGDLILLGGLSIDNPAPVSLNRSVDLVSLGEWQASAGADVTGLGDINILPGATLDLKTTFSPASFVPVINISATGKLNKSGSAALQLTNVAANSGVVDVQSGTLQLGLNLNHTGGGLRTMAGSTISLVNNHTFDAASSVIGAGSLAFGAGTHGVNGSTWNMTTTDIITAGADVTFNTSATLPTLNIGGPASFAVPSGKTVSVDALNLTGASPTLILDGSMTVNTALSWATDTVIVAGGGSLNNAGTLTYSGAGTQTINTILNNTDTFNVTSGTVVLTQGATHASTFDIAAGATLEFGGGVQNLTGNSNFTGNGTVKVDGATLSVAGGTTATFNAALDVCTGGVSGAGNVVFDTGGASVIGSTYNVTGTTAIDSGSLTYNSAATFSTLTLSGGDVILNTAGNSIGNLNLTNGTLTNNAATTLTGSANLGSTLTGPGDLSNSGSTSWTGPDITLSGVFNNLAGGTFEVQTGSTFNASSIINAGQFLKTGGAGSDVAAPFTNTGTVKIDTASLDFTGGFTQTGGTTNLNGGNLTATGDYLQTGGTTLLNGGDLDATGTIKLDGGFLRGNGNLLTDVDNTLGNFQPGGSPGTTTITGNFTQGAGGTLTVELGGLAQGANPGYDFLDVTGSATLGGTLNATLFGGFEGAVTNPPFDVIQTGAGFTGDFATLTTPSTTHTFGSNILATLFQLLILDIVASGGGGASADVDDEITRLFETLEVFIDEVGIENLEQQLRDAVPTVSCQ